MSTVADQRMSAEQYFLWCNLPENRDRHVELVCGAIEEKSRPGERHGFICCNLSRILGNYVFTQRCGYVCSNDTGLLLKRDPDTVRGPDLVLYSQIRRDDELNLRYSNQPPTLAIEVLSPTDRWGKMMRRITEFLGCRVAVVWLVDPEGRSVTVYRANQLPQVFEGKDELPGAPELPDFRCRVGDFFQLPGEEFPDPPTL